MSKLNTEALLAKDKNERMWFFLKGCIPTERTNAIFVMLSNISRILLTIMEILLSQEFRHARCW